jgi:hypothetical protein
VAEARVHGPNDDDVITRAGKAASALRYAVDLSADMRDLAYEQVKAGLAEAERAVRLADDMAAALRELHSPDPRNYCIACGWKAPCATRQMVDGFVPPGEVAALHHARATGDDQP